MFVKFEILYEEHSLKTRWLHSLPIKVIRIFHGLDSVDYDDPFQQSEEAQTRKYNCKFKLKISHRY